MKTLFLVSFLSASLVACSKAAKDPLGSILNPDESTAIAVPALTTFSYVELAQTKTVNAPFPTTIDIIPDSGTGGCTLNQANIILTGTYAADSVDKIEILGVLSADSQLNSGTFTSSVCLARGAAAVKLRAVTSANKKSTYISISFNISSGITSIAWGHPNYPAPGFRMNSSFQGSVISNNGLDLGNSTVESSEVKTIQSTGNVNYSFDTGYLNIVGQSL